MNQLSFTFDGELPIHIWESAPPPVDTIVWASYKSYVPDDWQLVTTCKLGCCVSTWFGSMSLPMLWRESTPEEQQSIQQEWDNIPQLSNTDLYDLYES